MNKCCGDTEAGRHLSMWGIPDMGEGKHTNIPNPLIVSQHKRTRGMSVKILPCYSCDINELFWRYIPQHLLIRVVTTTLFPAHLIGNYNFLFSSGQCEMNEWLVLSTTFTIFLKVWRPYFCYKGVSKTRQFTGFTLRVVLAFGQMVWESRLEREREHKNIKTFL